MPIYKVTSAKKERQKYQERIVRALIVLAGVAILYVFISAYGISSQSTTPDTPEGQTEFLNEMGEKGIVLTFRPASREMTVSDEGWKSLEHHQRVELAYIGACVASRMNRTPIPKIRIYSDANRLLVATVDENNLNIR